MSPVTQSVASVPLPSRDATVTVATLVDLFMSQYAGRDSTRPQRLRSWQEQCGTLTLAELNDEPDEIKSALKRLANRHGMYFGGTDATGHKTMRNKSKPIANATINRYAAALASVLAWAAEEDVTPKGWINPMKKVKQREEKNKIVGWLTPDECERLLDACKASEFDRLRLLVLMALVTGARRGELVGLRWCDINMEAGTAALHVTKNGSERTLDLMPNVISELDEERWKSRTEMIVDITESEPHLRAGEGYVRAIQHPNSALPVAAQMDQAVLKGNLKVA